MTNQAQRYSFSALSGMLALGAGAMGLRLRLTQELSAGLVTLRLARGGEATGKLRLQSPVIV